MSVLEKLMIVVGMDTKDVDTGVSSIGKKMEGVGNKLRGPGLAMSAAITAPIALMVGSAMSGAAQVEQGLAKANTVFGESIGVVQGWADKNSEAMGLTEAGATGLAASFGDLMVPMGFTREQAAGMATDVIGLSGALSAWSGGTRTSAEVADTLAKAMLGEREELKGLGISISQAEVDQKVLALGLDTSTDAAKQQSEAIATQKLIFEKSTDAQKAFSDSTQTLSERQLKSNAAMAQVKETIGTSLTPVMQTFASVIAGVANVFNNMPGPMKTVVLVLVGIAAAIGPLMLMIPALASTIGILSTFFAAGGVAAGIFGGILAVITSPITLIVVAILAVIAVGYLLIKHWDDVKAAASAVVEWILGAWNGLAEPIRTALAPILEIIAGPFRMAKLAVETAVKLIQAVVRGDFGAIPGILSGALRQVGEIMTAPFRAGVKLIRAALGGLVDIILWPFKQAMKLLEPIINAFKKVVALFNKGPDTSKFNAGASKWSVPQYATGGMIPGTGPQLAIVHGGERVLTPQQQRGDGGGITFTGPVTVVANNPQQLMDALAREAAIRRRAGGGR